jgi:hypothetical protein
MQADMMFRRYQTGDDILERGIQQRQSLQTPIDNLVVPVGSLIRLISCPKQDALDTLTLKKTKTKKGTKII